MNNLFESSKIIAFSLLMAFLLTACSKTQAPIEIEPVQVICDFVTINVTNKLDNEITGMSIDGVTVGNINSGETITEICLDQAMVDFGITYPLLQIIGTYNGDLLGENFGYCGVGVTMVNNGIFDVEITDASEYGFIYSNQ